MPKILQNPNPILRKKTQKLSAEEIKSAATKKLIAEMTEALGSAENGVGLAAPQIGVSKRIFVVLKSIVDLPKASGTNEEEKKKKLGLNDVFIFVNPEIIKRSRKTEMLNEGCLSVAGIYGSIKRSRQVTLTALNEKSEKVVRGAGGLLAQVFQHECDHLEGKLFIDNAVNLKKHEAAA